MQTYDKTAILGFVFTQNALKNLFATLAYKAITRIALSLSRCPHFLASLWAKFKGLFYSFCRSFISFYCRFYSFHRNFISSYRKFFLFHRSFSHLFVVAFRCIIVLNYLFTHKRHFLGHYAFLKFLNALFLGFLRSSLQAVFVKTADFVILSIATQRVARRKPQQKNPKNLRYALFLDTSLTLSMTKFMTQRVFGMTKQIGMVNLGCRPNFLKQMKNLKNLKNLQIFLKKILLEVQKRHYVSQDCVTMRLFKRKFAL